MQLVRTCAHVSARARDCVRVCRCARLRTRAWPSTFWGRNSRHGVLEVCNRCAAWQVGLQCPYALHPWALLLLCAAQLRPRGAAHTCARSLEKA